MKRKGLYTLLLCVALTFAGALVACGDQDACAAGHTYGEWVISSPASCTTSGAKLRTCSVCAHTEKQAIPAAHKYDENDVCTVCGYGPYSQGLRYALNADGVSYAVTGSDDPSAERVVVPKAYQGLPVTAIGRSAFAYCSNLQSIALPSSVTEIGICAFWGCCRLSDIEWSTTLADIGDYAFNGCSSLRDVKIPSGVTRIGNNAFEACGNLESIELPNSVKTIGMSAFLGCGSLTSVTVPSAVTSIGQYAFKNCESLTSLIIPSSITSIGTSAFDGCGRLHFNEYDNGVYLGNTDNPYFLLVKSKDTNATSCTINGNTKMIYHYAFENCKVTGIAIPDSVTSIGDGTFNGCGDLTSVTIGRGVTDIREDMFNGCDRLASITAVGENPKYSSQDGILYIKNKTQFAIIPKALSGEVTITGSITSIADYAFDSRKVTRIIMMSGVTHIGNYAFSGCRSLVKITIPNSVKSLGNSALNWCDSLSNITYDGTKEQWHSIGKGGDWNSHTGNYAVTCTNGTLSKEESAK